MGSNPMQKMKRNSILIGIIIGLLVGLILGVMAYFLLGGGEGIKTDGSTLVRVNVLKRDVKSGDIVTAADFEEKAVPSSVVPQNATVIPVVDENGVLVQCISKIDMTVGTVLTSSMISLNEEKLTNDLRLQEYNMIALPSNLQPGSYIDIRLQLSNGADYIVVAKKRVVNCDATTVWLNMYEEEIELLSNAIIEYYIVDGSKLYATTYTDPGLQTASTGTYVPNSEVVALINSNPNISALINSDRYSDQLKSIRNNNISSVLAQYYKDVEGTGRTKAIQNIETKIQEEIQNLEKARQAYYSQLNAVSY